MKFLAFKLESISKVYGYLKPTTILHEILKSTNSRAYIYIITGRVGPTGKTWLRDSLIANGCTAVEISGAMAHRHCRYTFDKDNYCIVDNDQKLVFISLSRPL